MPADEIDVWPDSAARMKLGPVAWKGGGASSGSARTGSRLPTRAARYPEADSAAALVFGPDSRRRRYSRICTAWALATAWHLKVFRRSGSKRSSTRSATWSDVRPEFGEAPARSADVYDTPMAKRHAARSARTRPCRRRRGMPRRDGLRRHRGGVGRLAEAAGMQSPAARAARASARPACALHPRYVTRRRFRTPGASRTGTARRSHRRRPRAAPPRDTRPTGRIP